MRLFLSVKLLGATLLVGSTCAVAQATLKVVKPASPTVKIFAQTMRSLQKDTKVGGFKKGDVWCYGVPGKPARFESPDLSVSARNIVFGAESRRLLASSASDFVTLKGKIVPNQGGLPLTFEATCRDAYIDTKKGVWTFEEDVKGFYETAKGRKSFAGDTVSFSRLDGTISIQQGTIEMAGGNQ